MADIKSQARPAVDALLQNDEDQLYLELGKRLSAIKQDPSLSGSFTPDLPSDVEALGPVDDLKEIARRFFARFNAQAYQLVCGAEAENSEEREQVLNAFGIGQDAVAAAIVGLLVSQLALAPAVAAVVAALIVRLFFRPAYESMCEVWSEKQP